MDAKFRLIEQMIEASLKEDSSAMAELHQKYGMIIAEEIAKVVSPVHLTSAPVLIAYLEKYAEELRKDFPSVSELADEIKKMDTIVISKNLK